MDKKIKILVTSIGSLVGQNIQESLEFNASNRRDKVNLIGTNSIAESPNNYKCDYCYLVPNTSTNEYELIIKKIIREVEPDLILSGRDEDTEAIYRIMESNPDLKGKVPYGNLDTLLFALDKMKTWEFSKKYKLPFAESIEVKKNSDKKSYLDFIKKVGFPLIAKPVRGYASKGVFFIRNNEDINFVLELDGYMLQEYLGDPELLETYFRLMEGPIPLFSHAPNVIHYSCHTILAPNGEIAPVFISKNEHDAGRTLGFTKVENKDLEKLTLDYANALFKEGGAGPVTVQFRKDRNGKWKAQEMNMRTNGNTFPRLMLGQDDIGLIIKYFVSDFDFPILKNKDENNYLVSKSLLSNFINSNEIETLRTTKKWTKASEEIE
ncbi:hypothetical protein [Halalkalibacter sp. APA_J-10(15)]|uniref:hypothetical protein n=1 Tax=unclassified Halalkalibacter TaxID=2893063 RepID=UPI001FF13076|nr:hypothetical protein [Halalkalibacter sp. APA_J-10(15)]MCK0472940.1 hypothetical protein [Halalkalibacter sp. APA_J-10(15)]